MAREAHEHRRRTTSTGIAVMSAAIAGQIDTDPAAAKASVEEVRRQSTAVLRDLRSLVGLLRDQDETAGRDRRGPRRDASRTPTWSPRVILRPDVSADRARRSRCRTPTGDPPPGPAAAVPDGQGGARHATSTLRRRSRSRSTTAIRPR